MAVASIQHVLSGKLAAGESITVQGWVRTRRDSKAGLSFINISDGSCFAAIQVVATAELANYDTEVKKLTAGCSVKATGTIVASTGQGQSFELQASAIESVTSTHFPLVKQAHFTKQPQE